MKAGPCHCLSFLEHHLPFLGHCYFYGLPVWSVQPTRTIYLPRFPLWCSSGWLPKMLSWSLNMPMMNSKMAIPYLMQQFWRPRNGLELYSWPLSPLSLAYCLWYWRLAQDLKHVTLGGMVIATFLGVFFYPMLYVLIGKIGGYEKSREKQLALEGENTQAIEKE